MFLFRSSPRANPGLILKGIIKDVNRKLFLKSKFKIGFLADSIKPCHSSLSSFDIAAFWSHSAFHGTLNRNFGRNQ